MSRRSIARGLRRLFRPSAAERDLDDEVRHYLEMSAQAHMRAGLSRAQAERAARVQFGGVENAKEQVRSGGWEWRVETLWRDVRHALRGLRRQPGFALVAIVTLALGIGVNTAMFSVVNAVILRPLPYANADRLALVWTDDMRRGLHAEQTAYPTILDWRSANQTFSDVAFYSTARTTLAGPEGRERTRVAQVSGNLFATLGVPAARGRTISQEDEAGAAAVAVISDSLWQRRFAADDGILGRTVAFDGSGIGGVSSFRIVGVMPRDFYFPDKLTDLWTPATTGPEFVRQIHERFSPSARRWTGLVRLKPGVSIARAQADLSNLGRRLSTEYISDIPDFPGFGSNVMPLLDHVAGKPLQSALWLLLGAVSLVLLVACANVANLLLARGAGRQHEFALRRALGAGRARLVRQLIVESLVLGGVGGAIGVALAAFGTRALATAAAAQLPRMDELRVDVPVLVFAGIASMAAALVFGIVPAMRVSASDSLDALNDSGRSIGGGGLIRTRGLLVAVECALAVVLLAGAGLLLRSLGELRAIDPGFDPSGVLTVRLEFPPDGAQPSGAPLSASVTAPVGARDLRVADFIARVKAIPGVAAAGFIDDLFIAGQGHASIAFPGRDIGAVTDGQLNNGTLSPGFFDVMRVPIQHGRALNADDAVTKARALSLRAPGGSPIPLAEQERTAIAEPVVVNDAFVRRFFPTEDPIGKRFCIDPTKKTYWYEIVGVIGDLRRQGLDQGAIPEYFGPWLPQSRARADLLVRTIGDPLLAASSVRQIVASELPGTLVANISTADRDLDSFSSARRFQTWLLTTFAALALTLAAIGIYGLVHYAVAERSREIGVRIALGAASRDVVRMVVLQGMRPPLVGITIGVAAALALTRLMTRLLFSTNPADPLTYTAVALTLAAVALGACLAPAVRASRLDPLSALRHE